MKWFFALVFIWSILSPSIQAACDQAPVEKRAVINWCGDCRPVAGQPVTGENPFAEALDASQKNLSRDAKVITFQGPNENKDDPQFASSDHLREALRAIKTDRDDWHEKNPTKDFSAYEVDIFITNHGSQIPNYIPEYRYTVAADPAADSLEANDLRNLGKALANLGVRMKLAFAQCYGQSSLQYVLDSYRNSGGSCGCGIAKSAPGKPSHFLPHGDTSWDKNMATIGGVENVSALQAGWRAMIGNKMGKETISDPASPSKFEEANNEGLSTSESIVADFFLHPPSGSPTYGQNVSDLEANSKTILKENERAINVFEEPSIILENSHAERMRTIAKLLGTSNAAEMDSKILQIEKTRTSIFQQKKDQDAVLAKLDSDYEVAAADYTKSIQAQRTPHVTALQKRYREKMYDAKTAYWTYQASRNSGLADQNNQDYIVASLLARERLEKAFFNRASPQSQKEFAALRKCELEQWGPGPKSPAVPSSVAPNKSVTGVK